MTISFAKVHIPIRALTALALLAGVAATVVVGMQSTSVSAANCSEDYYGTSFNTDGFFDHRCANVNNFPNTGRPFAPGLDGNSDSVGYVIPRTSKDFGTGSEALAGVYVNPSNVVDKNTFYERLRYHYNVRGWGEHNWWAKDGAAFVVFSLIDKDPPADRNLSDADWVEFSRRLNNPNLTMTFDAAYPLSPNSAAVYDTSGRLDFFHFYNSLGETGPSFVFKLNGNAIGSIERKCANLMGKFSLPQSNPWTTTATSQVGVGRSPNVNDWTPAKPGEMLYWRHTIEAKGGTTPGLSFAIGKSGFDGPNVWGNGAAANHSEPSGTTSAINAGSSYSIGWGANRPEYSEYRVTASDGGRTLCQSVTWGPTDYTKASDDRATSDPACVTVPYDYNLIPSVTGPNGMGSVGSKIPPVTPKVNNELTGNAGGTTRSPDTVEWQLKRIEVDPGGSIPMTQQEDGAAPCSHYNNGGANKCTDKGSGSQSFPAGNTTLAMLNNEMIDVDTKVGTRICFTLSVKPYTQTSGNWRHSAPVCITVSKQPKLQVWGGDVRTRGSIETGTTLISSGGTDKLFGSWVEYGGFSVGGNSNFASGSGLNNGNTSVGASSVWNKLTFANVNAAGADNYGMFTLPSGLPTLTDQFIGPASGGAINSDLSTLSGGTYTTGNFTTTGGTVGQTGGKGKAIIIISSGTVTIDGNITYAGPGPGDTFSSVSELPQVIIIARNINIKNTVTQLDAWLLTTDPAGAINTCSDRPVTDPLNAKVCTNRLTVNGPVVTHHLHLRRTAGSDTVPQAGDPAEVFNLRSDTYLWAYARASQSGKAQTVYSVELPPRF